MLGPTSHFSCCCSCSWRRAKVPCRNSACYGSDYAECRSPDKYSRRDTEVLVHTCTPEKGDCGRCSGEKPALSKLHRARARRTKFCNFPKPPYCEEEINSLLQMKDVHMRARYLYIYIYSCLACESCEKAKVGARKPRTIINLDGRI